ncbi:Alpha-1,3-mannosyl-glycoprotein 2-beta-N-acetylglucosaminyltransferase [Morus notabilis]|uniref:Alpha-1,3-mannosyl-glycoprotein 2-beta-N-acetylglucosaminyltransferase n=1 Tax=Morus notabilis TaxID=981085 RepID=W9R7X8_9ROSA|nr:Alpha-1,3-mannosyl-glycoprotein 2-beta-N-acetylglucosaminyltransferase [Morus notabilis]
MAKIFCDFRFLLFLAAVAFFYIQMRIFATQSEYSDRLAAAVASENQCTNQLRSLIDQISMQQERIVALEGKDLQRLIDKVQAPVAAVVIMACNRADYLERTIKSVLKYQTSVASKYPLFVSQDGSDPHVKSLALSYDQLTYMQHLDYKPVETERPGELIAYYKISRHYKWALDELFYKHSFSRVIILEDDMEIAPDFFDYFEAAAALLDKDKSIMAVSSWNDNGQKQYVHDPYMLYRSDFFPGLGWMLARSTWDELSPKWPKAYPCCLNQRRITKVDNLFVQKCAEPITLVNMYGSSMGQFYHQYLAPIKLNDVQVNWKSMDLSYLMEDNYVKHFADVVRKAKPIHGNDIVLKVSNIVGDVRIKYEDQSDFEHIARKFGIFEEWKDGVPRTAYKGIVVFRYQTSRRVFLVGPDSLKELGVADS